MCMHVYNTWAAVVCGTKHHNTRCEVSATKGSAGRKVPPGLHKSSISSMPLRTKEESRGGGAKRARPSAPIKIREVKSTSMRRAGHALLWHLQAHTMGSEEGAEGSLGGGGRVWVGAYGDDNPQAHHRLWRVGGEGDRWVVGDGDYAMAAAEHVLRAAAPGSEGSGGEGPTTYEGRTDGRTAGCVMHMCMHMHICTGCVWCGARSSACAQSSAWREVQRRSKKQYKAASGTAGSRLVCPACLYGARVRLSRLPLAVHAYH